MRINKSIIKNWGKKAEIVTLVLWLLYFLVIKLPEPVSNVINILTYPVILILIIVYWKQILSTITKDVTIILFLVLALCSVFWTADLATSLAGIRGLLRTIIFAGFFASCYSLKEQMKILAWVFFIGAVLSFIFALAMPSYGIQEEGWGGIFAHKNYLGYAMSLGASLLVLKMIDKPEHNWYLWFPLVLTISLSFLARSSASLINLVVLFSLIPAYQIVKQKYKLRIIFVSLICIIIFLVSSLILSNQETILVDVLGEGTTFNGRTQIWTLVTDEVLTQRPLLGYGYNAFWQSDVGTSVMVNTWSGFREEGFNSHNGYVELLAHLGLLGLFVFVANIIVSFHKIITLLLFTKDISFFWCLLFLIFALLSNIGDVFVAIFGTNSYSVIYMTICYSTALQMRKVKAIKY